MKKIFIKFYLSILIFGFHFFLFSDVADKSNPHKLLSPKQIIELAENNDPDAMCLLGDLYSKGYGVTRDIEKSIFWYEKAAKAGNADAEYWMGNSSIMDGETEKAFEWFLKSAVKGNSVAQYTLGEMYETGKGTAQNYAKAFEWYEKSALNDYVLSCFKLGKLYYEGKGTEKNYEKALNYLKSSLLVPYNTFQKEAEFLIGKILLHGNTEKKKEGHEWILKAAKEGHTEAQFELGRLYAGGISTKKDLVEGFKWLTLAGDKGSREAVAEKNKIRPLLNVKEIQKAQNDAFSFQEVIPSPETTYISSGTAFFITANGYLLTANHVIDKAGKIEIINPKGTFKGVVLKTDEANDIALLKTEINNCEFLRLDDSKKTALGETVFTVGFPNVTIQGIQPKYTKGEISSLAGLEDIPWNFQISIPVQPGNSGGPLVNQKGGVIGIIISILAQQRTWQMTGSIPQNVTYAVKTSVVFEFFESYPDILEELKKQKESQTEADAVSRTKDSVALVIAYRI